MNEREDKKKVDPSDSNSLEYTIGKIVEIQGKTIDALQKQVDSSIYDTTKILGYIASLTRVIQTLQRFTAVLIFVVEILVWRVFLFDPINFFFDKIIITWSQLSESYKIAYITLIGSIPAIVIANLASSLLFKKIQEKLASKK